MDLFSPSTYVSASLAHLDRIPCSTTAFLELSPCGSAWQVKRWVTAMLLVRPANLLIFLFSSLRCQWDRVPRGRSETLKANLATTRPVRMAAFSLPPRISDAEVRDRGKNTQPRSATRSTTWILCEINTRRDTASNPSVALPTGLISLESSATHRTPLRPVVAILLSSGITACKGNSGKLVTPQKDAVATITITCSPMLQQPNERMER